MCTDVTRTAFTIEISNLRKRKEGLRVILHPGLSFSCSLLRLRDGVNSSEICCNYGVQWCCINDLGGKWQNI